MNQSDSLYPIALIKRPRRRIWLFAALASLPLLGVIPILGIAQASRQAPAPRAAAPIAAIEPSPYSVDRPATITLGALIEVQRRAREQRRMIAATEQRAAELPPGEGWQAQLGAFSSADAAERQRARLIEAGVPVIVRQEGTLHRLHSLPAMRAETEGLCARAQANGVDCFVRQAI
ncbi:SPOR domain-containing protein [Sphingomonas sp. DG1-23]|uniref:SPOR domain-containing protein n=1 Tax=Sphingomonas sp. DG1-23 TaxID=3068316 RepID=UPI00273D344D|nr:SPOR domain-containing protein [Sphingomonas sp. DG1-23]MDP5278653.1 SPOR domain-containing protein [Sphingomonas sp. DG1-23]